MEAPYGGGAVLTSTLMEAHDVVLHIPSAFT